MESSVTDGCTAARGFVHALVKSFSAANFRCSTQRYRRMIPNQESLSKSFKHQVFHSLTFNALTRKLEPQMIEGVAEVQDELVE